MNFAAPVGRSATAPPGRCSWTAELLGGGGASRPEAKPIAGELHSDQGLEFEFVVFQKCCRMLRIKETRITTARRQSNGLVERFNRMLIDQVAKYCSSDKQDWDMNLLTLLMACRSVQHAVTTHTPAKLMFCRELRHPIDLTTGLPPQEIADHVPSSYVQTLQERFTLFTD